MAIVAAIIVVVGAVGTLGIVSLIKKNMLASVPANTNFPETPGPQENYPSPASLTSTPHTSHVSTQAAVSTGSAPDPAVLGTIAQVLATYFKANKKYPAALFELSNDKSFDASTADYLYRYQTDAPDQNIYSMCMTIDNSNYKCISSTVGSEPFIIPKTAVDANPSSASDWNWVKWNATSSDDILEIPFPRAWAQKGEGTYYTRDLLAQGDSGRSIIIARFNLRNYQPYTESETLDDFQKRIAATMIPQMHIKLRRAGPKLGNGTNQYIWGGTIEQDAQEYAFFIFFIERKGYFQELDFFVDGGMSLRMNSLLNALISSIRFE